jgi:hypothetical protein
LVRSKAYAKEHRRQINAQKKARRLQNHGESLRKEKAARDARRPEIRQRDNAWRAENREYVNKNVQKKRAIHHERFRGYNHKYRAQRNGLPVTFTPIEKQFCLQYFGFACALCGQEESFDATIAWDHWIPLSSPMCPGTIAINMIPLCHGVQGCNNSKKDRMPQAWLTERLGKRKAAPLLKKIEAYFEVVRSRH